MDYVWTPWRYRYVASVDGQAACVFCAIVAGHADQERFVLFRAERNFVVLNIYPYSTGHLMVIPNAHQGSLIGLDDETTSEMMILVKRAQGALVAEYNPSGFNIGMNIARCAGAGIDEHLHMHVVPRWIGDANFMAVVGETRVLPEDLQITLARLQKHFNSGN